jgi:cytochrome c551
MDETKAMAFGSFNSGSLIYANVTGKTSTLLFHFQPRVLYSSALSSNSNHPERPVRTFNLVIVCAGLALFLLACGSTTIDTSTTGAVNSNNTTAKASPTAKPSPVDEFASTRAIYKQRCEACHGAEGNGGPVVIDGKKLKVPSLHEGHVLTHPDAGLAKKIANGGDGMPPFKKLLKPEEIDGLVKFIHAEIQKGAAPPVTPAAK